MIVITGAAGFIGSRLAEIFVEKGYERAKKVLNEKISMLKKGMISSDNWNNDAWRTVTRAHSDMIREFQYWMRQAADKEAQIKKDPEDKHDPIDQGLFKPGDHFEVGYNGYLSFKGNLYDDIMKQNLAQGEEIKS